MASDALQILNLSPIPELSEMELSSVLEQLSGVSDQNGEVTDRNVEDILREAEELIDMSISIKTDSVDSKKSYNQGNNKRNSVKDSSSADGDNVLNCNFEDKSPKLVHVKGNSGESTLDTLNLSLNSDDSSEENTKSVSNKNEVDSSQSELTSSHSQRSLTNHIQSALVTLRECSKKIECQTKNSLQKTDQETKSKPSKLSDDTLKMSETEAEKLENANNFNNYSHFGEETEKVQTLDLADEHIFKSVKKSCTKQLCEKNQGNKKGGKRLGINESIRTLDCFERLYRGKPVRTKFDSRRLNTFELQNDKKSGPVKMTKATLSRCEMLKKGRNVKNQDSVPPERKGKPYNPKEYYEKFSDLNKNKEFQENMIDEDISFEKCLQLLNEENEVQNNDSFNYPEFTEKIIKHYTASVNALQGEVEDLKNHLKKNENPESQFTGRLCLQDNLIQILKEENSKLLKEIEEIKGQLKANLELSKDSARSSRGWEKAEVVEKLRMEVENLRRNLITAHSESNGILRLEEQFSLLKEKYDQKIGKLEGENKKLKEILSSDTQRCLLDDTQKNVEVSVQTENIGEKRRETPRTMIRSVSLENCRTTTNRNYHFREKIDAATSPISPSFQKSKELCSVSIQCEGDWDVCEGDLASSLPVKETELLKEFQKQENKENVDCNKRKCGKVRPVFNVANQLLNSMKQKKVSEHENQLMVTVRALHSEITVKDRENKKMKNELEMLRSQVKRLTGASVKRKCEVIKKFANVGTQTIGLASKTQDAYDPAMFQVSREIEDENEELKLKVTELEKYANQLKDKRILDLQILQKLHEEEIDKLASRLNTQTALTNHLHSLLMGR